MRRSNMPWLIIVVILLVIIGVLGWIIMKQPASVTNQNTATTTQTQRKAMPASTTATTSTEPLSKSVSVTEPIPGATVGNTFTVSGKAPGRWYSEASFPIQLRDQNDNVIARSHGSAQGDWMTAALVPFTATVTIDTAYKGSATLILLRDNPSGLPENDDSVSIPVVVQ